MEVGPWMEAGFWTEVDLWEEVAALKEVESWQKAVGCLRWRAGLRRMNCP